VGHEGTVSGWFFISVVSTGCRPSRAFLGFVAGAPHPAEVLVYFVLLLAIGLRARSGFLAALSLASYSEFGLIVMQSGVREVCSTQLAAACGVRRRASFVIAHR